MQVQVRQTIHEIERADWNRLVPAWDPFLDYDFLRILEDSGCVGENTTWQPLYFLCYRDAESGDQSSSRAAAGQRSGAGANSDDATGQDSEPRADSNLIGAVAAYIKFDSYGEYVFDHAWAHAYAQGGLEYYPKLLVAVPFTPVNGRRFLIEPGATAESEQAIIDVLGGALRQFTVQNKLSSAHVLFCTENEQQQLEKNNQFLKRISSQFHWQNLDYKSFEDYLGSLRSSKRKQIRKERRQVESQNLEIKLLRGDEIQTADRDAMWQFYVDTGNRKWGRPYLNERWFELIFSQYADRIVLLMASDAAGRRVAGTLNFFKGERIFGRYWGAIDHFPCLHFELCYYRLIEFAIDHNLELFEAGAQGEQKFLRGFETTPCFSSHWFVHPQGQRAIADFLDTEYRQMNHMIESYNARSPLKSLREQNANTRTADDRGFDF